jgi:hypothetical protein
MVRQTLEPRSVVITSEDMGRPAENIEYYGGIPALYVTDLERWHVRPSDAALWFIMAGVRPYLLVDKGVRERAGVLADLASKELKAELVADIPSGRNMEYFVASPARRDVNSELFRISHPRMEELRRLAAPKPGG